MKFSAFAFHPTLGKGVLGNCDDVKDFLNYGFSNEFVIRNFNDAVGSVKVFKKLHQ